MSATIPFKKISNKLILYIILFSSMITGILTLIQLYSEYREQKSVLDRNITNINTGYRKSITNAVWLDDKQQLIAILDGVVALPDIEYVEVRVNADLYASRGERVDANSLSTSFPLHYQHDSKMLTVGNTTVEASLSGIYNRLLSHAWAILGLNAIKTFFVAIFMYFLFDHLVFRRLQYLASFVRQYDIQNVNKQAVLETSTNHHYRDEITEISSALNTMQVHLSHSLKELLSLKKTLDLSLDGIFMFYPVTYKFYYVNAGATKLLGYDVDELLEMTPIDISPDMNESRFEKLISSTLNATDQAMHIETLFQNKQGDSIPVRLLLQYLHPKNEEPRFAFMARDISERKIVEKAIQISLDEVKSASEAKTKFMMSMSHELRTPLTTILGFSQLLELDARNLTPEQNDSVHNIVQSGQHLLKLIEDLLDLSAIESNRIALSMEAVDPVWLINECVHIVYPMAVMKDIRLINNISGVSLPNIKIDQTRFKQIFINLLSNAIKYNRTDGSVSVDYELKQNNMIRFEVSDTGIGIPMSEQSKVFRRFDRLGLEAGGIEGVGIGLNITKELVEKMGGHINFKSTVGQGSCFWIDLPSEPDENSLDQQSIAQNNGA